MIALEVTTNGHPTIIAGNQDLSVLSAGITAVGELAAKTSPDSESPDIFLNVGGLEEINKTHPLWINQRKITIGDEITIRVIETDSPDPPLSSIEKWKQPQTDSNEG